VWRSDIRSLGTTLIVRLTSVPGGISVVCNWEISTALSQVSARDVPVLDDEMRILERSLRNG
jgi:hypothetical protein